MAESLQESNDWSGVRPIRQFLPPQRRDAEMSNKRNLNEDIALIENLVQDQFDLIESRLRDLDQLNDPQEALKKIIATLTELQDSCTLVKALLGNIKDGDNGQVGKSGAG
jgi:hypothetical protein